MKTLRTLIKETGKGTDHQYKGLSTGIQNCEKLWSCAIKFGQLSSEVHSKNWSGDLH